jgi:hypothetical protein
VPVDPGGGGAGQPGAFTGVHGRRGSATRAESAGLDFDERDRAALAGDDVDLVSTMAPVRVENSDALSLEPGRGVLFPSSSGLIQVCLRMQSVGRDATGICAAGSTLHQPPEIILGSSVPIPPPPSALRRSSRRA